MTSGVLNNFPVMAAGGVLVWLALSSLWWAGGWLVCSHAFTLRPHERLLAGLGSGLLLFIVLGNLLGHFLPFFPALWAGAASVLALGLAAGWRSGRRPWLDKRDLQAWPLLLILAVLWSLLAAIGAGLAIFDDYYNLPIVSRLAAGDLPPHNFLNPSAPLDYHYGLHLFAASLVRLGGRFPWDAFDCSKALVTALAPLLAGLWVYRLTRSRPAAFFGAGLVFLGGGARWLLLLLPGPVLQDMSGSLGLLGSAAASGTDFASALLNPWKIEGGGPFPFPFAYANGIFPPLVLALGGSGAAPQMTAALLLLLACRRWRLLPGVIYGLLLSSLALIAEQVLAMFLAGLGLAWLVRLSMRRAQPRRAAAFAGLLSWGWVLLPALVLALLGGGVVSGLLFARLAQLGGAVVESQRFAGFSLHAVPAVVSAHFGPLVIYNPPQLLVLLAELGPVVLLAPLVLRRSLRSARRARWVEAAFGLGAGFALLVSLFVVYGVERDTSRLAGSAVFLWMLLAFPPAWMAFRKAGAWGQAAWGGIYAAMLLGGVVIFMVQWIAIPNPVASYFIGPPDAQLSRMYWDRLEAGTHILDPIPYRAVTLFGRDGGRAYQDVYEPFPEWNALLQTYDPAQIAGAGYSYLYLDKETWQGLSAQQKDLLSQPCVKRLAEANSAAPVKDFRWLLDLSQCR